MSKECKNTFFLANVLMCTALIRMIITKISACALIRACAISRSITVNLNYLLVFHRLLFVLVAYVTFEISPLVIKMLYLEI